MSDTGQFGADAPQGPGWWQASDGKWYPPESAPAAPAPASAGASTPAIGATTASAVELTFDAPLDMARWRPFVSWFLAIPHYVLLFVYGIVALVYCVIAFFSVLFTRRVPPNAHTFIVKVLRYAQRVTAYTYWMTPDYPAFGLAGDDRDPGDQPVRVSIEHADELKQWAPLYKWFLAIPHFVVLYVLGIVTSIVLLISAFVVLFTGEWNEGMRKLVVGFLRWQLRVDAYLLLRDEYPPFSLD